MWVCEIGIYNSAEYLESSVLPKIKNPTFWILEDSDP